MSAGLIWHCRASKRAWHCSASSAAACSRWSSSTYDGYCRDLWCMWCMHQPGVTNALTNHKIIFYNTRVFLYSAEFLAIWTSFCLLGKNPIRDIQLQKHNFTWSSRSWFVGICIYSAIVCVCGFVLIPQIFREVGIPFGCLRCLPTSRCFSRSQHDHWEVFQMYQQLGKGTVDWEEKHQSAASPTVGHEPCEHISAPTRIQ